MLLQESFCIDQHKFSGLYGRRSNNNLMDYLICDELTDDFGGGQDGTFGRRLRQAPTPYVPHR
jgi:hypothetical protein